MHDTPKTALDKDIAKVHELIAKNLKAIEFYVSHKGHLRNPVYWAQIRPAITVPGLTALYRLAKRAGQDQHAILRSDKTAQIFEDKQIQELIKSPAVSKFIVDKITSQILSPEPTDQELVKSIFALSTNTLKHSYKDSSLRDFMETYAPIFRDVAENVLKQVLVQKLHGGDPLKATFVPSPYADMPAFIASEASQCNSAENVSKDFKKLMTRFDDTKAFQSIKPVKIPVQNDRDKEAAVLLAFLYTMAHILTPQKALTQQLIQEHDARTFSPNKTPAASQAPGKGPMLD